jgi:hypothetical protein
MEDVERSHIIREGDTPLRLSVIYGIPLEEIVEHPKNEALKGDFEADMLPVGEVVIIPAPQPLKLTVAPQSKVRFSARLPKHRVVIRFSDEHGPLANEPYRLIGLGPEPIEGSLDGEGTLDVRVPASIETLRLRFEKRHVQHTVWVGHLPPAHQQAGARARLLHLGYGPVGQRGGDPYSFTDSEAERRAVESFQRAFGLEPSGFADDTTVEELDKLHGTLPGQR